MRIKIFRCMICLLLVCVLLVNVSPIRAEASAGALLGPIVGVTSVNVPAGLAIGAAVILLGVMAGTNDDFYNMVESAISYGTSWAKDGAVELLRVVDEYGKIAYYAAADMLCDLQDFLWNEKYIFLSSGYKTSISLSSSPWGACTLTCRVPFNVAFFTKNAQVGYVAYSTEKFTINGTRADGTTFFFSSGSSAYNGYYLSAAWPAGTHEWENWDLYYLGNYTGYSSNATEIAKTFVSKFETALPSYVGTNLDLVLGDIPMSYIDGSSALDWSEEYASKRIYVTGGSNDPDPPDENNGKWFWPIALPLTGALLYSMSQADEWSGETPQEFDQYIQNTEFEILDRPEFDGYQAIEIAPVTNPGTNPDPGTDPDPTAPGEPNPDPEPEPDPEPDPEPSPDPGTDPDVDPDVNPDAGGNGSQKPESPGVSDYTLDLRDFFPFCIPFDIYDLVQVLDADPEAPHFVFDVDFPYMEEPWHIDIDFSTWDPVALVLRRLELLLFIVGLAMATRNYYIRG